jgi:hypothetical protein
MSPLSLCQAMVKMVRLGVPHLAITDSTGEKTHSTSITLLILLKDARRHFYNKFDKNANLRHLWS